MRSYIRSILLAGILVGAVAGGPNASAHTAASQPSAAQLSASAAPSLDIAVTPNPMKQNTAAYVSAMTTPGAACHATVVYSNGQQPTMFQNTYNNHSYT